MPAPPPRRPRVRSRYEQAEPVADVESGHAQADVKEKLANVGAETIGTTPAALEKFVRAESDKFEKLIRLSGAKGTD